MVYLSDGCIKLIQKQNLIQMRVKYNRVSTHLQTGNRFEDDKGKYDLVLFDKVSGSIPFFERLEVQVCLWLCNSIILTN
jgi:hypothetical protein